MIIPVENPVFVHEDFKTQKKTEDLQLDNIIPTSKTSPDDDVFLAPEVNAFGHQFRDYADANNERQKGVEEFYKTQHTNQTLDFVRSVLLLQL
nr:PREDICTED: inositol oxygenase 5-like [Raphanus sativus]